MKIFPYLLMMVALTSCSKEPKDCGTNLLITTEPSEESINHFSSMGSYSLASYQGENGMQILFNIDSLEVDETPIKSVDYNCDGQNATLKMVNSFVHIYANSKTELFLYTRIESIPIFDEFMNEIGAHDIITVEKSFSVTDKEEIKFRIFEKGYDSYEEEDRFSTYEELEINGVNFRNVFLNNNNLEDATLAFNLEYGVCAMKSDLDIWFVLQTME